MRRLIPTLIIPVLFASCGVATYTAHVEPEPSYVLLKNGKKIEGEDVSKKEGFFVKKKIVIDGKEYKLNDVSLYSTGKDVYANIGRKTFAEKVMGEEIKVYRNVSEYTTTNMTTGGGMSTSTHTRVREYVQLKGSGNSVVFKPFVYKNVKDLIPANSASADMLQKHHNLTTIGKTVYYTGIATMIGGAILAFTHDPLGSGPGIPVTITGIGLFAGGGITIAIARPKLHRAVDSYNIEKAKERKGNNAGKEITIN
jgi:hypothetical protein